MEEIFSFQNDLFEETIVVSSLQPTSYQAKLEDPKWFLKSCPANEDLEMKLRRCKCICDYFYMLGDYESVLVHVKRTMSIIPSSNQVMRRDLLEMTVRSLIAMNRQDDDLTHNCLRELTETAFVTDEQYFVFCHLLLLFYRSKRNFPGLLRTLQHMLLLNPYSKKYWTQLRTVAQEALEDCSDETHCSDLTKLVSVKGFRCLDESSSTRVLPKLQLPQSDEDREKFLLSSECVLVPVFWELCQNNTRQCS